jgi:hypothetical protein
MRDTLLVLISAKLTDAITYGNVEMINVLSQAYQRIALTREEIKCEQ